MPRRLLAGRGAAKTVVRSASFRACDRQRFSLVISGEILGGEADFDEGLLDLASGHGVNGEFQGRPACAQEWRNVFAPGNLFANEMRPKKKSQATSATLDFCSPSASPLA